MYTQLGKGFNLLIRKRIDRGRRLIEGLMRETLETEVGEETIYGMEHHMDEAFMDGLWYAPYSSRQMLHQKVLRNEKRNPRVHLVMGRFFWHNAVI